MAYSAERRTRPGRKPRQSDPFRYGVRIIRQKTANGRFEYVRTPMPREALLHPLDEDYPVESNPHNRDCVYLRNVLEPRLPRRGVVLMNCRVDWEVPGVQPHGPDIAVFSGVRGENGWQTFHVRQEKARPILVIEITSRNTRRYDVKNKVDEYYRAGVPLYAIVDARMQEGVRTLEITGYRAGATAYERVPLDDRGRLLLKPLRLLLGTDNGRVCCYDAKTQEKLGDHNAVVRELERAVSEKQQAVREKQHALERIHELEAELRKLRGTQ